MFKLIKNEQKKLFRQKSTLFMFIALAVTVFIGIFMIKTLDINTDAKYTKDNWRQALVQENKRLQKKLAGNSDMANNESYIQSKMRQMEVNNYYLENNKQPVEFGAWYFVFAIKELLPVLSLLTIIIAAGIVANEYRWGTIKLLLIRPMTRTKIMVSKYISVLLFAFIGLIFFLLLSLVVGAIFYGVEGLNPKAALFNDGKVVYESIVGSIFEDYGLKMVNLVMMATFAFMISSVFRNSSIAIGVSIFLMMTGSAIVNFLASKSWMKYILFSNTDLTQYTTGFPPMKDMTLGFSITMLIVYYVVFLGLSWVSFVKRDISGAS